MELCVASLNQLFSDSLEDGDVRKYCGQQIQNEEIILQLATGLEYIHDKQLVHRDLKPQNVLVWEGPGITDIGGRQIVMKWADFGLSKPVNEKETFSISDIKGTLHWFAPEMIKLLMDGYEAPPESNLRKRGTTKSDIFAEGLTFAYIMLEGKHPHGNKKIRLSISTL